MNMDANKFNLDKEKHLDLYIAETAAVINIFYKNNGFN